LKLQSLFASNTSCPVAVYRYSGHYEGRPPGYDR
jgi:hypothetical protein